MKIIRFTLITLLALFSVSAHSAIINWTDWESSGNNNTTATGTLMVDGTEVDVMFSATSAFGFMQTGTGTNYWSGTAYTDGNVDNAPTPSELIALNAGGTVTLTFSSAIENIYFALNSWNGNVVEFDTEISIDSSGAGYWGSGSAIVNSDNTGFTGSGEFHGIILAEGEFTSISFTHTSENWHGFTLGVEGLADEVDVPAPATALLMGLLLLTAGRLRKH